MGISLNKFHDLESFKEIRNFQYWIFWSHVVDQVLFISFVAGGDDNAVSRDDIVPGNLPFLFNVGNVASLVQCRGSLCNVGVAFAATDYYQKINQSKIKIDKK